MTNIVIRKAAAREMAELAELKARAALSNPADVKFLTSNPDEAMRIDADAALWVLESDGNLCAFIGTKPVTTGILEIAELFTDPPHMRKGFARRLVDHVLANARSAGFQALLVDANPASRAFYSKMGFHTTEGKGVGTMMKRAL